MEQVIQRKKRENNPIEKANLLSRVTFFYNYEILKKGKKRDLEPSDLYKVVPEFQAEVVGNRLEEQWKLDKKTGKKLWRTLVTCFGFRYLVLCQPKAISNFVKHFQHNQSRSDSDAYFYSISIIGLLLLNSLYVHNLTQLVTEYSLKIRTAVCSLIFRKALKLSPQEVIMGRAVTLVTKDVFAIDAALVFLKDIFIGILHLLAVGYAMYDRVGSAVFPPLVAIVLTLSLQILCGKMVGKFRLETARKTDERFRLIREVLSSIKAVKMYCWQNNFGALIDTARLLETNKLAIVYYLKALIGWLGAFINNISFSILLLGISQTQTLQADTVYFIQQCFFILRTPITTTIPMGICNSADLWAAFKRIQTFLDTEEVVPRLQPSNLPPKIFLKNVKVSVEGRDILRSVSVSLSDGLMLVTGNIGSGKSVLIKAILGEYPVKGGVLEVSGSVSYASQVPWLFPGTVRQNIVFEEIYDSHRYQEVLRVCALTHDINRLDLADETIVGDNGFNLSKGLQARVSLARAIYKDSDIYLLDDCMSSLDNNISDYIFNHCLKGFLRGKICLFVTNNVPVAIRIASDHAVLIEDGKTLTLEEQFGGLDKRITYFIDDEIVNLAEKIRHSVFQEWIIKEDEEVMEKEDDKLLLKVCNGNSEDVYREDKKSGGVSWFNYATYLRLIGGRAMALYLLLGFAAAQAALTCSEKIISLWVNTEANVQNTTDAQPESSDRNYYFNLYTLFIVVAMVVSIIKSYSTFYSCLKAARIFHSHLIEAILKASMTFFDSHYIGNIINRLGRDFYVLDEQMPFLVLDILTLTFSFISVLILVASVNWVLLLPGLLLIGLLLWPQRFYLPAGRSLRRLEASTRSSIIGLLDSTMQGLVVIRSAQQQSKILSEFDHHQDLYTSAYFMSQTTMRFFALSLDVVGMVFVAGILLKFMVFYNGETAGDIGLALSQAMTLSAILQYGIKQAAELETVMTSVERVLEYVSARPEALGEGRIPPGWPSRGKIALTNLSLTYKNSSNALRDISLQFDAGSKVGIVGRTGSGKSSLISALFRLYTFQGRIVIDDEDVACLNLHKLRTNLTIISQDPAIFSGTIRENLDPFNEHPNDEAIWRALDKVYLKPFITSLNDSSALITSTGQRQLLHLARALLQDNKIIIFDEATTSLDHETDLVLQKTLRDSFRDCTVLIVAHKSHSVMWCDKVLTLRDGRVAEFDAPLVLMRNKGSILRKMIREDNFEMFGRICR
ncbi:ATP-binding cassette sub-family C member 4-like isoform X2 [Euwallacea similis]|uniref:ATP-binding cassette sub-family C member 4-like isoform X2 n=1 Tax=Euwallacea similis TaxID=1736056 RepID=UPI00344C0D42